ncbi:MAG TPA: queuosine precursor transporter [Saprospiraceae bacterium]|nr:queuosine precursor transporter [Saprospiraceae bacterium]
MPDFLHKDRSAKLFIILSGLFITIALVSEVIGVKIFSLEKTLGLDPVDWSLFGMQHLSFNLTAGVLSWPLVFVLSDIINEYFGIRAVRFLSILTSIFILFAFFAFSMAIGFVPADFWPTSHLSSTEQNPSVQDLNKAYQLILGQGNWIIIGSLVAFLVGQILDAFVFQKIKVITGSKHIWLRATGSTMISQWVDSYIVLFIAFYIGAGWPLTQVLAIGTMNYFYKATSAIVLTPLIYLAHYWIDKYLKKSWD